MNGAKTAVKAETDPMQPSEEGTAANGPYGQQTLEEKTKAFVRDGVNTSR